MPRRMDTTGAARRFRPSTRNTDTASWGFAESTLIQRAIVLACESGGALRFGLTRDGGAYAIGVYGDGPTPYTEYLRPHEDVNAFLEELCELWEVVKDEKALTLSDRKNGHK